MRPIFVFSVPRSGSTWLGQLFNSSPQVVYGYQPLFSYAFKGAIGPDSSAEDMRAFLNGVAQTTDPFVRHGMSLEPPRTFEKRAPTHVVVKEVRYLHLVDAIRERLPEAKIVALVRSPLAVLASWRRAPKEFDPSWTFRAEWRRAPSKNAGHPENAYGFDAWLDTTLRFDGLARSFPEQVQLVEYASLLAEPVDTLESLFSFCGLPLESQTRDFLAESQEYDDGDPYGVFRAAKPRDEQWVDQLEPAIVAEVVTRTTGTPAERFLYGATTPLALEH